MMGCKGVAAACLAVAAATAPAHAATNMLFVLDGSNSMWGQVDGVAKMATAKEVLGRLVAELPADTRVGLMAYGHRREGDCEDVELVAELGALSAQDFAGAVNTVTPTGKTPIAHALASAGPAFEAFPEENNHIVVISDGLETCGGDPCAAAAALAARQIKARVHVVGFALGADEQGKLDCIAANGGGQYFRADSTEDFRAAVAEVQQVAQAAEPAPPEPRRSEWFRDDFDGEDLAEHWEIINPDPNSFIVEDGELLMIASEPAAIAQENVPNVFRLTQGLPKGDWVMTAKASVDFQTGKELMFLGVYDDPENHVVVQPHAYPCDYNRDTCVVVKGHSVRGGKDSSFEKTVWHSRAMRQAYRFDEDVSAMPQPIYLRLRKAGRKITPGIKLGDAPEAEWTDLESFTVLRLKGVPAVGFYQAGDVSGESAAMVDWVRIETVE